jgi:plasmid stabilization system protein ParE
MAWKVLITDSALADLREIVDFIAQDNPEAAERMGQRLVARALDLAEMPERHSIHDASPGNP